MSRIQFFTDEDLHRAVAVQLRLAQWHAISTPEVNRLGESDESQLAWSAAEGRVLVTFNTADFARLHYSWRQQAREHAGLIVSQQRAVGDTIRRLIRLGNQLSAEDMRNRLEYLSNW